MARGRRRRPHRVGRVLDGRTGGLYRARGRWDRWSWWCVAVAVVLGMGLLVMGLVI